MASLEKCADALFQQKAVQSSNHERLERQVLDLERSRRSSLLGLRGLMASVQRRGTDLSDVMSANVLQEQQLVQDKLKLSALTMGIAEDRKRHAQCEARLTAMTDAWMGQPARVVQLIRALQERSLVLKGTAAMRATMLAANDVVAAVNTATAVREWANGRLVLQRAHHDICREALSRKSAVTQEAVTQIAADRVTCQERLKHLRHVLQGHRTHCILTEAADARAMAYGEALALRASLLSAQLGLAAEQTECLTQSFQQQEEVNQQLKGQLSDLAQQVDTLRAQRQRDQESTYYRMEDLRLRAQKAFSDITEMQTQAPATNDCVQQDKREVDAALSTVALLRQAVAVRQRMKREAAQRAADRKKEETEAFETLAALRLRHTAHVEHQRAVRAQARLQECVLGLEAEESLTRRLHVVAKEADERQLLQERMAMATREVAAKTRTAAAVVLQKHQATEVGKVKRSTAKRPRRATTGTVREHSPSGTATVAEALGLGQSLAAAGAEPHRRTHPPAVRRRATAMYPAVTKDFATNKGVAGSGCAARKSRADRSSTTALDLSDRSSPSPKRPFTAHPPTLLRPLPRPSAVATGASQTQRSHAGGSTSAFTAPSQPVGDRRPLRCDTAGRALVGLGPLSSQDPNRSNRLGVRGKPALRPTLVRHDYHADGGEDLFADIFS